MAGAMSASGTEARKSKFEPQMQGFLKVFPPLYYGDRFPSWQECNRFCERMAEDVITNEDPETVAGVIIEPADNTGGIITPNGEHFQILREVCSRYNVMPAGSASCLGVAANLSPYPYQNHSQCFFLPFCLGSLQSG